MTIQEMFDANNGFLEAKELTTRTQWNQLNRMLEQGLAVKIKRGLYAAKQDSVASQRVEVARMISSGIFCLFTAWNYHQLTT
ncbi:MAG: hypothetical protein LBR26_00055 [Prevotella sp.]|jgi:hypothetical protein|nr:hypothetical protein [Prevotella sp.]